MQPASPQPWTLFWPRRGEMPLPGKPICPATSERFRSACALWMPLTCWVMPIPQMRLEPANGGRAYQRAAWAMACEGTPVTRAFIEGRTEGFDAWRESLAPFTLDYAARVTGVPSQAIAQAARWYARPPFAGSSLIWGMGITQHVNGIHNAHALLNLSLVAGQMGFPGSGISPLRGQNNVQGCGDAGCIPTNLPGYQHYEPATLARFARAWG